METGNGIIDVIPQDILPGLENLIFILQALGGFIILYITFNVINIFINRKKNKELKRIGENVNEIKRLLERKKSKK